MGGEKISMTKEEGAESLHFAAKGKVQSKKDACHHSADSQAIDQSFRFESAKRYNLPSDLRRTRYL